MTPTTTQTHPRRRAASPNVQIPSLEGLTISKGATFHSPKSPASAANDPVLDVASIPRRQLTSPEGLAEVLAEADARISSVLDSINQSLEGVKEVNINGVIDKQAFPVPRFLIAHAALSADRMDVDVNQNKQDLIRKTIAANNTHEHASDSGLGTSVSGDSDRAADALRQCRFCDSSEPGHADIHEVQVAAKRSVHEPVNADTPILRSRGPHELSAQAAKKIKDIIVDPILKEDKLKDYHKLVENIPQRIGDRKITCLRDLEKTLIYLAPTQAKSAASYLNFAETSIQAVHTTVDYLNERDQRRPTDRPYTNTYFLDLVQQVRQYARIMAISRQKQRRGEALDKEDFTPGEKLRLEGGILENGQPAALVREKPSGESIAIDAGKRKFSAEDFGDDAEASMARKRKCDQGKIDWQQCRECLKWFKRPCDLTKHEKTHSRPWKCPEVGCKYHDLGWPTEKERDRHINDRHTSQPNMYNCIFEGCTYSSKRESNCKQHMEKTHGYTYVRSKSRKGEHLTPTAAKASELQQFPADPSMGSMATSPSESSAFHPMSTPSLTFNPSPYSAPDNEFSPASHNEPFMGGGGDASLFPTNDFAGPSNVNNYLGVGGGAGMPMNMDEDLYGYPSPSNVGTDTTFSEEDINKTLNFKDPMLMSQPEAADFLASEMQPTKDLLALDGTIDLDSWNDNFESSGYGTMNYSDMMMQDQTLFPEFGAGPSGYHQQ